jgi:hypothetical protein
LFALEGALGAGALLARRGAGCVGEIVDEAIAVIVDAIADLDLRELVVVTIAPTGLDTTLRAVFAIAPPSRVVGACVTSAALAFFARTAIVDQPVTIVVLEVSADVLGKR